QPYRLDVIRFARFEDAVPHFFSIGVGKVYLKAARACISCGGNQHIRDASKSTLFKCIWTHGRKVDIRQRLKGLSGMRALNSKKANLVRYIIQFSLLRIVPGYPIP